MAVLLIILGIIVALAIFVVGIYNRLVALRQTTNQAWSDIEVQLKQRQDLVPQLVNTVKGYAGHEKGTFKEVPILNSKPIRISCNCKISSLILKIKSPPRAAFITTPFKNIIQAVSNSRLS